MDYRQPPGLARSGTADDLFKAARQQPAQTQGGHADAPSVHFGTVTVVDVQRRHRGGGGVPSSGIAPLGLGWNTQGKQVLDFDQYQVQQKNKAASGLAVGREPRHMDEAERLSVLSKGPHSLVRTDSLQMEASRLLSLRANRAETLNAIETAQRAEAAKRS
eukprot:CAMPEP_0114543166 /NCGR_PEP_ID=MMETSP0114-20121206/2213_1 /TAXON_ID=31324 /ORGANISM="Goniomonas sp, Strain m" /LENGTH=160 /DNA_ID=CAMNT_0001727491 /DNA_START=12 /DNA_END=494 /DNA_ORIENTATION=-